MAACMATILSLTSCASLALRRSKAFPVSGDQSQQHSVSFPITVTPLRIERERRRGCVFGSFNPATFVTDGEVESAVEDGAGRAEELFGEDDQFHYAQIDAFTDRAYSGNPAAVLVLPKEKHDKWLQLIAREFNLSELAFLVKRPSTRKGRGLVQMDERSKSLKANKTYDPLLVKNEFNLCWFTPTVEVDLCGHATLASAHLLFAFGLVEGDTVIFHIRSGVLKATKVSGYLEFEEEPEGEEISVAEQGKLSSKGVVQLNFPLSPPTACDDASLLSEVLGGVEVKWVGMGSVGDYLVELQSSGDVEKINPKFGRMLDLPGRGVIQL